MAKKQHLAQLQLAIMHVLWEKGEATVAEVRESLEPDRRLAYTTVGTMLAKLEEKGHVRHRSDGRTNVYRATVGQQLISRSMVTDLADRLFNGDITQMVCHLLDGSRVTPQDLAQLKRLISQKEKELKDGRP